MAEAGEHENRRQFRRQSYEDRVPDQGAMRLARDRIPVQGTKQTDHPRRVKLNRAPDLVWALIALQAQCGTERVVGEVAARRIILAVPARLAGVARGDDRQHVRRVATEAAATLDVQAEAQRHSLERQSKMVKRCSRTVDRTVDCGRLDARVLHRAVRPLAAPDQRLVQMRQHAPEIAGDSGLKM